MPSSLVKRALSTFALPLLSLFPASAWADDTPCGKFDISDGVNCHIEVAGGCKASCTPLKFEAYCEGGCTAEVTQTCTDTCQTSCIAECDPNHLDCVAGCHTECEQPCIDQCQAAHPTNDCVTECKSSCNMHCDSACGVTVDSCLEHCRECCHGACDTQVNLDCDIGCFAKLDGECSAQCDAPTGALFCNGHYLYATDVNACIAYLAQQNIEVNVEARGSAECDLIKGCEGGLSGIDAPGCAAAPGPGQGTPQALSGIAIAAAVLGIAASLRRSRR